MLTNPHSPGVITFVIRMPLNYGLPAGYLVGSSIDTAVTNQFIAAIAQRWTDVEVSGSTLVPWHNANAAYPSAYREIYASVSLSEAAVAWDWFKDLCTRWVETFHQESLELMVGQAPTRPYIYRRQGDPAQVQYQNPFVTTSSSNPGAKP